MHLPSLWAPCLEEGCTRRTTEPTGVAPCRGRGQRSTNTSPRTGPTREWGAVRIRTRAPGAGASPTGASCIYPVLLGRNPAPAGPPPLPIVRQAAHLGGRQADHFWPLAPPFLRGPASCAHPTTRRRTADDHHMGNWPGGSGCTPSVRSGLPSGHPCNSRSK